MIVEELPQSFGRDAQYLRVGVEDAFLRRDRACRLTCDCRHCVGQGSLRSDFVHLIEEVLVAPWSREPVTVPVSLKVWRELVIQKPAAEGPALGNKGFGRDVEASFLLQPWRSVVFGGTQTEDHELVEHAVLCRWKGFPNLGSIVQGDDYPPRPLPVELGSVLHVHLQPPFGNDFLDHGTAYLARGISYSPQITAVQGA